MSDRTIKYEFDRAVAYLNVTPENLLEEIRGIRQ
jgi:hypothetical protein